MIFGKHHTPSTASPQTPLLGKWTRRGQQAKLHRQDVQDMRAWAAQHPELTQAQAAVKLAARYHVHVRTVQDVLARRAWASLPDTRPAPSFQPQISWWLSIPARWHALILFLLLMSGSSRTLTVPGSSGAASEGPPGDSRPAGPRKETECD